MRTTVALLTLLLVFTGGCGLLQWANANGSDKLLDAMQAIRQGDSKDKVRSLLGRDPQIIAAMTLPDWLMKSVPEKPSGEYWYFYMGFPSRNLIIYFDESETVSYVTWQTT